MYVRMIRIREEIHQIFVEYLLKTDDNHKISKIEERNKSRSRLLWALISFSIV